MEEGERKLCLVEPTLELTEEVPLQVQMQLVEAMEALEALEAGEEAEALVEVLTPNLLVQQEMEVMVELVVMEEGVEEGTMEG